MHVRPRRVASLRERYCRNEASASSSPGYAAIDAAMISLYTTAIDCSSATESCILRRRARRGVVVLVMLCDLAMRESRMSHLRHAPAALALSEPHHGSAVRQRSKFFSFTLHDYSPGVTHSGEFTKSTIQGQGCTRYSSPKRPLSCCPTQELLR